MRLRENCRNSDARGAAGQTREPRRNQQSSSLNQSVQKEVHHWHRRTLGIKYYMSTPFGHGGQTSPPRLEVNILVKFFLQAI